VVENFAPGVAARLGVDYPTLARDHPALVYLSVSGFGQDGPLAARPAYDAIAQAMSGIMTTTGEPDGPPTLIGESLGDLAAALYGAFGVMVALFERERSGRGRRLEVAMLDALVTLQPTALVQHLYAGRTPRRVGNRHPLSTPFGEFAAGDGHLVIAVLNQGQFERLAAVIGRPELAADPRYASDAERTRHEPELRAAIEGWSRHLPVAEAPAALEAARVPAAPVWTLPEALASEHLRERGLLQRPRHPQAGELPVVCQPVRFEGASLPAARPAPGLGEHGAAILTEAGLAAGNGEEDDDA